MIVWKRLIWISTLVLAAQLTVSGCGGCDETTGQATTTVAQADAGDVDASAICEDADDDGFAAGGACEDEQLDCDDEDPSAWPGADEVCGDGIDNNCDGQIDENCDDCTDGETRECGSEVGICEKGSQQCNQGTWSECDGVRAVREVCDGVDNDCDGEVDEDPDASLCTDGINCNGAEVCDAGTCVDSEPVDCTSLDEPCFEGLCQEKDGSCTQIMIADGTTCDDGNFCTVEGVCGQGICETAPRDCSGAADQCNTGVCDEDADACVPQPISDGTTCDDGSFCTVSDACQTGTCTGASRDCASAGDQCNDGICDENTDACVPQPIADGTTCDDGQYCTVDDVCQQGQCAAGTARVCGAAGGSCRTGVCDEQADSCTGDPVPDGTSCEDGQFCTVGDACQAGTCAGGGQMDCASVGDQCNDGVCDESNRRCAPSPRPDGITCDDDAFCTTGDVCTSGSCAGSARDCSGAGDQCNSGTCDEQGDSCVPQPISDGTSCDDTTFCTVSDTCSSGTCGGSARACAWAGDQCNDGVCDENAASCVAEPVSDGTSCNDGEFCTVTDACSSGTCGGSARDCSAESDQCNTGVCDENADSCMPDPVTDGTTCDDSTFCTVSDACTSGTCAGSARDCSSAGDQCNDGVCDESLQSCVAQPVAEGTSCADTDSCTVSDVCSAGSCGGSAMDCSALTDQCNVGMCDPSTGSCVAEPVANGTSCNDGSFCTVADACNAGVCGGGARDCSSQTDQCNTGVCDENADSCVPDPVTDGTTCDDSTFCTVSDACTSGTCAGSARDCSSAGDQCNDGVCDESLQSCVAQPVADGTSCADTDSCTVSDVCSAGSCGGSAMDCSALTDQCNVGMCDPSTGSCVAEPVANGTSCNDGSFCTVADACNAGVCGGGARDCSSQSDQCNTGVCDENADSCVPDPVSDGTTCNDGLFCTASDTCTSGACGGSSRDCSAFDDQCNAGACDEGADTCFADPLADGTSCDDSQYCTVSDQCISGSCDSSPRDCSAYEDQCNVGVCDETNDTCYADSVADGTTCNDNQYCTVSDECSTGLCGGSSRDCSGVATSVCSFGVCDESYDRCVEQYDSSCCDTSVDNDLDGSHQCIDCDDTNGGVYPGASEQCNGVDDDCDGAIDEDFDADGDGYATCTNDPLLRDCDDTNAGVNPGATENCGSNLQGNGIDDDCDGYVDEGCNPCTTTDVDGDGYSECDGDCDDNDANVNPGATEQCDGLDNDCNTFTTLNCDVDQPCNFTTGTDVCMDDRLCACIVNATGSCTGDYRCTTYCNWSETGPIGDGCGTDQTCLYDMLRSSNVHACGVTTETPGPKGGGEACSDGTECRSLICDKLCRGPGCNQDYCQDYCGSDDYCGTGAICRLRRLSDNIDGRCWPAGGPALGTTSIGQSCSSDSSCDHGLCMTDSNTSSTYCTGPCCEDSDCPAGYNCSVAGDQIDTSYVYPDPRGISCTSNTDCTGQGGICFNNECAWRLVETSPMCVKDVSGQGTRVAGQQCSQNAQCESNFCEKNLGVCLSVCCNDSTCPTGLSCEGQTVQTDDDRVSQVRVCLNVSTENILEPK